MTSKKTVSRDSNYIAVVIRSKLGKAKISVSKVIIASLLYWFDKKKYFFEGWSRFKFSYLELVLGTAWKFYDSLEKVLELDVTVLRTKPCVSRSYTKKEDLVAEAVTGGVLWKKGT